MEDSCLGYKVRQAALIGALSLQASWFFYSLRPLLEVP